jgi:Domain of unknown function (DUF4124)
MSSHGRISALSFEVMRIVPALLLLVGLGLAATEPAAAADITYRCQRADGSVEYTNRPCEGDAGEAVVLPEVNTFEGRAPAQRSRSTSSDDASATASEDEEGSAFVGYSTFEISDPTPEKLYLNVGGAVTVSISISPRLQQGHGIMLYLDGQPVSQRPQPRTTFNLTEVWPVVHTVRAEVVDMTEGGGVVSTTPDVQFFVRQSRVN